MALVCSAGVAGVRRERRRRIEPLHVLRGAQAEQLFGFDHQGRGKPAGDLHGGLRNRETSTLFGCAAAAHLHTGRARIVLGPADRTRGYSRAGLAAARRGAVLETEPAGLHGLLPCHVFSAHSWDVVREDAQDFSSLSALPASCSSLSALPSTFGKSTPSAWSSCTSAPATTMRVNHL